MYDIYAYMHVHTHDTCPSVKNNVALQHTATHGKTLQQTATNCNTL